MRAVSRAGCRGFPLVDNPSSFGPERLRSPLSRFCRFRYAGEEISRAIAIPLAILNAPLIRFGAQTRPFRCSRQRDRVTYFGLRDCSRCSDYAAKYGSWSARSVRHRFYRADHERSAGITCAETVWSGLVIAEMSRNRNDPPELTRIEPAFEGTFRL